DVEVDDADRADAGSREIERDGRAEAARADAEDLRRLQLALPLDADFRQDQVPAVALEVVVGQLGKFTLRLCVRLKPDTTFSRRRAAGDRRDDADRVAGVDRRLFLLQIP